MGLSQQMLGGAVGALNAGGKVLRLAGVTRPRLDRESLLTAAHRRTGLDELGDWAIDEAVDRLLESYESEAALTALGRITAREMIVSQYETLLYMERERQQRPEITDEPIVAPVFIIGLPRTGTTILHNLICASDSVRKPLTYEVWYPSRFPPTAQGTARAQKLTQSRLRWAGRLVPEFRKIHPMAPDLPQECIAITAQVFMSIQFHTTHNVASYQNWFEQDSQQLAYDFHRRMLQHLQSHAGERLEANGDGCRWLLKAPGHLFALDALLKQYPDAKIVQTHRDPLRVTASMASHACSLRQAFSDDADPTAVSADWSRRWGDALHRFLNVRDRSNPDRFLDVAYNDIESDPLAAIERIFDFAGWSLEPATASRIESFLAANPKNKHGVHRYSLAQYGLSREEELKRYQEYCERFEIPIQADA